MKGIEKLIKNNYKIVIGLILGILVSSISVYALENIAMIDSEEVSYDNTESHGDYKNVQESIDELYERSGVKTTKWIDPILHGADPVLNGTNQEQSLIPVTIDPDGTVRYANLYTEWYNYSQKRWANAVILVDSAKTKYSTGDIISETDIESYFVWIPRYKYKIWNTGNYDKVIPFSDIANVKDDSVLDGKYAVSNMFGHARIIDVVFGDTAHVTENNDAKKSGTSGDTSVNVGDYLIHPAFTLGETELNGIWVGKFETGYKDAKSSESARQKVENSKEIIIKPNVFTWRDNTIKNFFMSAYKYKEELKSHMMKNTEWGAVTYLTNSSYGIGGEININNHSEYKTGYSSASGTDQNKYPGDNGTTEDKTMLWNTSTGYLASTTGNITGVYDMVGGTWEYMAAYISGNVGQSGFTSETEITTTYKDYVDIYDATSSANSYNKRILGDATGEMGPFLGYVINDGNEMWHNSWYGENSVFVYDNNPWFFRGGAFGGGSTIGQLYFYRATGAEYGNGGFRVVLSIS